MLDNNVKLILFAGILVVTLLVFWAIIYRNHKEAHQTSDGQGSWNRNIGTFLIIFAVIIAEYELIFKDEINIAILALLLGYAIGGKIVNGTINETKKNKNETLIKH